MTIITILSTNKTNNFLHFSPYNLPTLNNQNANNNKRPFLPPPPTPPFRRRRRHNTSTTPSTTPQRPNPSILTIFLGFIYERDSGNTKVSNLNGEASHTENEQSHYLVVDKTCLTAQFIQDVREPVGKALSSTALKGVVSGDAELCNQLLVDGPDITLFSTPKDEYGRREVVAVGNVMTFWTFSLENYPVSRRASDLLCSLERPIGEPTNPSNPKYTMVLTGLGNLIHQMRTLSL